MAKARSTAGVSTTTRALVRVLGGRRILQRRVRRLRGFTSLLRSGLPYGSLVTVCRSLNVRERDIAPVIGIARRTLARRKESDHLEAGESDRLFRVARIFVRASAVLGADAKAARWMSRPQVALGDSPPLQLLDTEVGEEEVLDLLGRIEHGVLS